MKVLGEIGKMIHGIRLIKFGTNLNMIERKEWKRKVSSMGIAFLCYGFLIFNVDSLAKLMTESHLYLSK